MEAPQTHQPRRDSISYITEAIDNGKTVITE